MIHKALSIHSRQGNLATTNYTNVTLLPQAMTKIPVQVPRSCTHLSLGGLGLPLVFGPAAEHGRSGVAADATSQDGVPARVLLLHHLFLLFISLCHLERKKAFKTMSEEGVDRPQQHRKYFGGENKFGNGLSNATYEAGHTW